MTRSNNPSVGRIVHVTFENNLRGPEVRAALISHLNDDGSVQLSVFLPTMGGEPRQAALIGIPRAEFHDGEGGTPEAIGKWSWPRYVP